MTLKVTNTETADSLTRHGLIRVYNANNLFIQPAAITSADPGLIPVSLLGTEPLGAISLYLDYDDSRLTYQGIQTHVPGEIFYGGVVGDRISIQWFDETGGDDPIVPGEDPDTLFSILVTNAVSFDSTHVTFHKPLCMLGDRYGNPITDVAWADEYPYGMVYITVGAQVSGRVAYYWLDRAVPDACLSLGLPSPDVCTDAQGQYAFDRCPPGIYELNVAKSTDLGGINSLDAIKVVRHSAGQEPLNDPYKLMAANVNGDALINALDAIKIVRAAVGLEPLASGDWKFDPSSVAFAPLDRDSIVDFVGVRMGDVNGSWVPNGRDQLAGGRALTAAVVTPQVGARETISLALADTTLDAESSPVDIPLVVSAFDNVGAISLRIAFADSVLDYRAITSRVTGVAFVSNLVGNEIRIEWFDPTGGAHPITIGTDTLLTVSFDLVGEQGEVSPLDFTPQCTIGDAEGDPIEDVQFIDGLCRLAGGSTGVPVAPSSAAGSHLHPVAGGPAAQATRFVYDLSQASTTTLDVFDVGGRLCCVLVDRMMPAGRHVAVWSQTDLSGAPARSGIYFVRLQTDGYHQTRKFVLLR